MGRLPCNHYLLHYPSRRVIADFCVIADFHVIRVVSGTLCFLSQAPYRVLTCIGNFSCRFTWIRNHLFLLQIDDLWAKTPIFAEKTLFNELGVCVCVVGTFSSYLNAKILHPFQGFELAVFKPFFYEDFKDFSLKYLFKEIFGGLTPIDWTSKCLLQSFNFKWFCAVFLA